MNENDNLPENSSPSANLPLTTQPVANEGAAAAGLALTGAHAGSACPRCGTTMVPSVTNATTKCSCGFAVPTEQIKEMDYLRYGLPLWAARLNELDAQLREAGSTAPIEVLEEAVRLRQGLPAWQARLDLLTDAVARAAESGAVGAAAAQASSEVNSGQARSGISAFRLVLTLGALLFISGAAALSFFVGSNYGAYAQLATLLALCAVFGWASLATRERTRATATALSAITVGGWFLTMLWFGYEIEGGQFWRNSSPLATTLAAITAVVFFFSGKKTRTDLWLFASYISGTLTLALACLYGATAVQHLGTVSPTVGNAVLALPLSLMATLALQDRLPIFEGRVAARLTSAYIALGVSVLVAITSLLWLVNVDGEFDSRGWLAAGLFAWSGHVLLVSVVLYRSKQRANAITGITAIAAGVLFTGGFRALDQSQGMFAGVLTAVAALAITAGIVFAIRSQEEVGREARLLMGIFGTIAFIAFMLSSVGGRMTSVTAYAWSAHAVAAAWILTRRGKQQAATAAATIALGVLGGTAVGDSLLPESIRRNLVAVIPLLLFAVGTWLIVRRAQRPLSSWPVPAVASVLFVNFLSNSPTFSMAVIPVPLIPSEFVGVANSAAIALLLASTAVAILSYRDRQAAGSIAGAALGGFGLHLLLRTSSLEPLEKWTIPLGASALVFGFLARRANPTLNSTAWLAPAAFTLTLPSAVISIAQPAGMRLYIVVAAVVACLAMGLITNYAGLLLPGAIGTVLVTLQPIIHKSNAAAPFISLLLGGGTLIALGWKFERLRSRDGFRSLR